MQIFILFIFSLASSTFAYPPFKEEHITENIDFIIPNIVGGHDAKPHSAPFQISLQVFKDNEWVHNCGGSIVEPDKIITAGHCVFGHELKDLRVVAGEHDFTVNEGTEQIATLKSATFHPRYDDILVDFDYGVIRLSSPLNLSINVSTVALPKGDYIPKGNCTATGWGNVRGDGTVFKPSILQEVVLPIVDLSVCKEEFEGFNPVTDRMICAGAAGQGPCGGDSGGPLVCNGVLAGIVSWGYTPCGLVQYPGVFANVVPALGWFASQ